MFPLRTDTVKRQDEKFMNRENESVSWTILHKLPIKILHFLRSEGEREGGGGGEDIFLIIFITCSDAGVVAVFKICFFIVFHDSA